jgi:hypothetical protein
MKKETPKAPPKRRAKRPPSVRKCRTSSSRWTEQRALSRIRELSRTLVEVSDVYEQVHPGGRNPGHVTGEVLHDAMHAVANKLLQAVAALNALPEGEPPDES